MAKTMVKRALLTGAGSMFLQSMTNKPDEVTAPTYAEDVFETPSLDKVAAALEVAEKTVRLSNQVHSEIISVKKSEITVDAGYFPDGFAEEHTGMIKIGDSWTMPTNPQKKPFRYAQPFTDEEGNEIIYVYPYCFLTPVDVDGETERDDVSEKMQQFKITALPLPYKITLDSKKYNIVYNKIDLSNSTVAAKYDRNKLLEQPWYDTTTLAACAK